MLDIGLNCKVELHFALRLSDTGELVDSTFGKKPASLVIGDGNLPDAVSYTHLTLPTTSRV